MTADRPVQHWPGRMVDLPGGDQGYLAQSPWSAAGERDLVLCVHGMSGAATNWTDLIAELAPDFDCAGVDLPGSGFSAPPAKRSGYSVRALAKTVIRLIETLDRGPVHLVGNSMGGAISIRVAASRPDLVKTLTLISPVLPDLRPHLSTIHFPILALPFVGRALTRYWARVPAENPDPGRSTAAQSKSGASSAIRSVQLVAAPDMPCTQSTRSLSPGADQGDWAT